MTSQGETLATPRSAAQVSGHGLSTANGLALTGLAFGVLANVLMRDGAPVGAGFSIWLLLLGSAVLWMLKERPANHRLNISGYVATAVLASVLLVVRDSDWITVGLLMVILTCAGMTYLVFRDGDVVSTTVAQQFHSIVRVPYQAVTGFLPYLPQLQFFSATSPRVSGILRGLVLVLPILAVFIALFASADIVVDRLISDLSFNLSSNLMQFVFITFLFGWIAAGLLAGLVPDPAVAAPGGIDGSPVALGSKRFAFSLGEEEVLIILGLVAALFAAFVVLQTTYLFGGQDVIQRTTGLTVADYARRGFFELMWVAGLTLILLLAVKSASPESRLFKPIAILLVTCVMIMLASASQRLGLYVNEFGLTIDRMIASAVMIWLAVSLLLFAVLTLKDSIKGLAAGISHLGMLTVIILAMLNPAAYVSAVNISRATDHDRVLDIQYLLWLGADAVPVLLQNLDNLAEPDACAARSGLLLLWGDDADTQARLRLDDWRSWNFSRARATESVQSYQDQFQAMTAECAVLDRSFR